MEQSFWSVLIGLVHGLLKVQAVSDASVTGVDPRLADQSFPIRRFSLTSAFFTNLFGTFHFMKLQGRIRATLSKVRSRV